MTMTVLRDAEIFDMDGTLNDVTSIRHYVLGKDKNYHKFHTESINCPPVEWVAEKAREAHREGRAVLIVTAREFRFAMVCMYFLKIHNISYEQLYMRRNGDYRPDSIVKQEILDIIRKDGYNVIRAYDDNPSIWDVWESAGIETIRVEGFGFE